VAETCPTCLRPFRDQGEQHDDGIHCPASPRDHRLVRDDLACALIGVEVRAEQLAAARALNDRSRLALIQLRDKLDAAIAESAPCTEPTTAEAFPGHVSAPDAEFESASAEALAAIGGHSNSSRAPNPALAVEPTSATPAGDSASQRPQSCDWSLEIFDLGFRVGRCASLGELHIVLTESGEGEPVPTAFELPSFVLEFLLAGTLPETKEIS